MIKTGYAFIRSDVVMSQFSVSHNDSIYTYDFEEGMTWEEFIDSKYNTPIIITVDTTDGTVTDYAEINSVSDWGITPDGATTTIVRVGLKITSDVPNQSDEESLSGELPVLPGLSGLVNYIFYLKTPLNKSILLSDLVVKFDEPYIIEVIYTGNQTIS